LDRVTVSEAVGCGFDSRLAHHIRMQSEPKRPRILAVEDNLEFAELLRHDLNLRGYDCESVPNGAEGLKKIMAEDFDVVLCDVMMPHMPGPMFYLAVQKTKPHIAERFVFMTGFSDDSKVETFIRESGRPSLWKPFPPEQLYRLLRGMLSQES
jgi:CheY-like chemotaxis protein